jgi:uncharacterized membrane protein
MVSGTVHDLRLALALLSALVGLPVLGTAPAHADLRVCNQTGNEISIALGYRVPNGWQSEGWWVAPPSQCATVFEGDLGQGSRFFYIFAADDIGGGAWDGDFYLCTTDETFTIFGYADCLARGYERTGFFEVDTQNRSDWMLQLTDAENAGRPTEDVPDETIMLEGDVPMDGGEPMEGEPMEGELPPVGDEGVQ